MKQKHLDIVCLSHNYTQVIGDYFEKTFAPKVYGKIKTREILPDNSENRKALTGKGQLNTVRFLKNVLDSESDILIWEERVIMISFCKLSPMAVAISDPELVKSIKSQFEALWGALA